MTQFDRTHLTDQGRLARELHDGIAQDLVGVGYSLDLLLADPATSMATRSQLRALRFTVTDLIGKVRKEIYFLRQASTRTLAERIDDAAKEYCEDIELHLSLMEVSLTPESELSYEVLRIAEEILRNVGLHSDAQTVSVSLNQKGGAIELCIADDGIGGARVSDERYGIRGIFDRTSAIGGVVDLKSDTSGTRVCLRIPIENHPSE